MYAVRILLIAFAALSMPRFAGAHAFGQLYNLPVPFWLYLYGAAAALLVSFFLIGYLFSGTESRVHKVRDISPSRFARFFLHRYTQKFFRHAGVFFLALTLASGIIGANAFSQNFNMTFFWIVFWLGMTYMVAIFGNAWAAINPWKTLYMIYQSLPPRKEYAPVLKYPSWLGVYPALILYVGFIWLELVGGTTPLSLSLILAGYSALTFAGMRLFGKDIWLSRGEFFSVYFDFIAQISPLWRKEGKLMLRAPFVGLLDRAAVHASELLFILFMVAATSFDGIQETLVMLKLYLRFQDFISYDVFRTICLVLSPLVFLASYLFFIWLARQITRSAISLRSLALGFAATLIPIALAYNVAHYYTLLLVQGQEIFRLISDPFGYGWDLFGTADYAVNVGIVQAGFVWHSQVAIILVGHIASVYLAHTVASTFFKGKRQVFWSQVPMLMLMMAYTVLGLWILSQPITLG